MSEAEHHQQELERQQMLDELAEEANFAILMSAVLPIETVSTVINGTFIVEAYKRKFKVSVEEI
jgi:hypothetical protein